MILDLAMSFGGTLFGVFTDVIFNAFRDVIFGVFRDVILGECRNVILGAFRDVICGVFRDVICGVYEVGGCRAGCEDGESEKAVSSCGQLHFSALRDLRKKLGGALLRLFSAIQFVVASIFF